MNWTIYHLPGTERFICIAPNGTTTTVTRTEYPTFTLYSDTKSNYLHIYDDGHELISGDMAVIRQVLLHEAEQATAWHFHQKRSAGSE